MKDDNPVKHVGDNRKYGTVGRKPREHPQSTVYHALPRSSYLVLPPGQQTPHGGDSGNGGVVTTDNTPDLLQDHDLTGAGAVTDKVDVIDNSAADKENNEEEDIYISTKF